ncbi:hypothetical protein VNO77_41363 [Canavalia gladiata]|uniref:Uncharacterized protein n=1 Tax=Canavalia gladiata TaxID=3824 RepID=A0AAN9K0U5_CANGL
MRNSNKIVEIVTLGQQYTLLSLHLRSFVEVTKHGLNYENQKVGTTTALYLATLVEAATPHVNHWQPLHGNHFWQTCTQYQEQLEDCILISRLADQGTGKVHKINHANSLEGVHCTLDDEDYESEYSLCLGFPLNQLIHPVNLSKQPLDQYGRIWSSVADFLCEMDVPGHQFKSHGRLSLYIAWALNMLLARVPDLLAEIRTKILVFVIVGHDVLKSGRRVPVFYIHKVARLGWATPPITFDQAT